MVKINILYTLLYSNIDVLYSNNGIEKCNLILKSCFVYILTYCLSFPIMSKNY